MGKGGNETSVNKFEPPDWVTGGTGDPHSWSDYVARGGQIADVYATNPHMIYGNDNHQVYNPQTGQLEWTQPQVAQMSDLQNRAANGLYGMASVGQGEGGLQQQTTQNAYGTLNSLLSGQAPSVGANQYAGDNPYIDAMIKHTNDDTRDAFSKGTAAQTDAAFARKGAYGGSAYDDMVNRNNVSLAKELNANATKIRGDQYDKSAALEENNLNRQFTGQQTALQNQLSALGLNNQQNQGLMQLWQGVMGAGDLQQQTQQNNINAARDLFNANVQQPISALDLYGSVLQRASGQGGTNTVTTPGASPWASLLGGGMAGLGLLGGR